MNFSLAWYKRGRCALDIFLSVSNNDSLHSLIRLTRLTVTATTVTKWERLFCCTVYFCFVQTVHLPKRKLANVGLAGQLWAPRLLWSCTRGLFCLAWGLVAREVGEARWWSEGLWPSCCQATVLNHCVTVLPPPTLCILEALQMVCGSLHAGKHLREATHPPSCKFVSFKGAAQIFFKKGILPLC